MGLANFCHLFPLQPSRGQSRQKDEASAGRRTSSVSLAVFMAGPAGHSSTEMEIPTASLGSGEKNPAFTVWTAATTVTIARNDIRYT